MKNILCLLMLSFGSVSATEIILPKTYVDIETEFTIPVVTSNLTGLNIKSFTADLTYDTTMVEYLGFNNTGTNSQGFLIAENKSILGKIRIVGASSSALVGEGVLLFLRFKAFGNEGNTGIQVDSFEFSEYTIPTEERFPSISNGQIIIGEEPINTIPQIDKIPDVNMGIGENFTFQTAASDADGDSLDFSLSSAPVGMTINTIGLISWISTVSDTGANLVEVKVDDHNGGVASTQFYVNVKASVIIPPDNNAPQIGVISNFTVEVNENYLYQVSATDEDGDILEYSLNISPEGMNITDIGLISWIPVLSDTGANQVEVEVDDKNGGLDSTQFLVNVTAPIIEDTTNTDTVKNSIPQIEDIADHYIEAGDDFIYQIIASDMDDDTLIFSLNRSPEGMEISDTGFISWISTVSDTGVNLVEVKVDDLRGGLDSTQFYIRIQNVIVPIELVALTANVTKENDILIRWETASETNNLRFDVLYSYDDKVYSVAGMVVGAGTSTETHKYDFLDKNIDGTKELIYYKLKQVDYDGRFTISEAVSVTVAMPGGYELTQNYPNPFNPYTNINFTIPQSSKVELKIYDILGREVRTLLDRDVREGYYNLGWDGKDNSGKQVSAGAYLLRIVAGKYMKTMKMIMIK